MRVIKRGVIPDEKIYTVECYYCKSILEFKRVEAKRISDQREGDYLEISCLVCGRKVTTKL